MSKVLQIQWNEKKSLHLEAQTHRSGTENYSMQNIQSPLKYGLAWLSDLISCFSPSTTLQSHLQLYFCSSVTPKSFPPKDFCSDCLRSPWPSSPNLDFSLNFTCSERPFLPLQSEVEPPKSLSLVPFNLLYFIYQQNFCWFNYLSLLFLEWVPQEWGLV